MQTNIRTAPETQRTDPTSRDSYIPAIIVAAIVAVTAAVMCHGLRQAPVWLDEAVSLWYSRLSWPMLWSATRHIDSAFLFYYGFLRVIGDGNLSLPVGRIISVVCALATIPLVYLIGVRVCDRRVAYTACILCATNFLFLMESREVRMYALLCTVCTAAWLLLLILEERPTVGGAAAYIAVTGLSLLIHPLAIFNVCALVVATFMLHRTRSTTVTLLACTLGSLIALVPVALVSHDASASQIGWITNNPKAAFRDASGGRLATYLGFILTVSAIALATSRRKRTLSAVVVWLTVPPALGLLVSYTVVPVLIARYFIEVVPASALLIAWLLWNIPTLPSRITMIALAIAALFTIREASTVPRMAWNTVNHILLTQSRPGDAILFFPADMALPEAEELRSGLTKNPGLTVVYPSTTTTAETPIPPIRRGYHTLWTIIQSGDEAKIEAMLAPKYRIVMKQRLPGLSLSILMEAFKPR